MHFLSRRIAWAQGGAQRRPDQCRESYGSRAITTIACGRSDQVAFGQMANGEETQHLSSLESLRGNSDRFAAASPAENGNCSHCPDKCDEHYFHFCMAQKGQRLDHLAVQCTWACPEGMHACLALLAFMGVSSSCHCEQRNYVVISSCHVQTPCRFSVLALPLVSIS